LLSQCFNPSSLVHSKEAGLFVGLQQAKLALRRTNSSWRDLPFDSRQMLIHQMPGMLHLNLQFQLSYAAGDLPFWFTNPTEPPSGTIENATLVVLDNMMRLWKVVNKQRSFVFSILELLTLVGETRDVESVPDYVFRSGISIRLQVHCYNHMSNLPPDVGNLNLHVSSNNPLCVMLPQTTARSATHLVHGRDSDTSLVVANELVGVHVYFMVDRSYFEFPDFGKVVIVLTSLVVALSVPKLLMWYIITKSLGNTSHLYRDLLVREANLNRSCASWIMELATKVAVFIILANSKQQHHQKSFQLMPTASGSGEQKGKKNQTHGKRREPEEDYNQESSFITKGCFCQFIQAGLGPNVLTRAEIHNLSMFPFSVLLPDLQQDEVDVKDFVKMAMRRESISVETMLAHAQLDQRRNFLGKNLTDSGVGNSFVAPASMQGTSADVMPVAPDANDNDALLSRSSQIQQEDPCDNSIHEQLRALQERCKRFEDKQEVMHKRFEDVLKELYHERCHTQKQLDAIKLQLGNIQQLRSAVDGGTYQGASAKQASKLSEVDGGAHQKASAKQPPKLSDTELGTHQEAFAKQPLRLSETERGSRQEESAKEPRKLSEADEGKHQDAPAKQPPPYWLDDWQREVETQLLQLKLLLENTIMEMNARPSVTGDRYSDHEMPQR